MLAVSLGHCLLQKEIVKRGSASSCLDIIPDILQMYIYTQIYLFTLLLWTELAPGPENRKKERFCHLLDILGNSKDFSTGRENLMNFISNLLQQMKI